MKVRFLTSVAGMNFAYRPKRVYDLPEHVALAFIRSRQAEVVEEAVSGPPEVAVRRRGRRGRRVH